MMCDPVTLMLLGNQVPSLGLHVLTYKSALGVILSSGLAVIEAVA